MEVSLEARDGTGSAYFLLHGCREEWRRGTEAERRATERRTKMGRRGQALVQLPDAMKSREFTFSIRGYNA